MLGIRPTSPGATDDAYLNGKAVALASAPGSASGTLTRSYRSMPADSHNTREELATQLEADRLRELEFIIRRTPAVVFLWRNAEGWPVEYVSDNIDRFGYTPDDFYSGRMPYADIVHPDDLAGVADEVARYSGQGLAEFTQAYRIVTASGETRWNDDRTWVRRDADGNISHYIISLEKY